jgi:ribosome recycling factor
VTQAKGFSEQSKIAIRNARRDANKHIETQEKEGEITEDEVTAGKEQVQELTKRYETKVDELISRKQNEIMQV